MPRIQSFLLIAATAASIALVAPMQQQAHAATHRAAATDVQAERALVSAMNIARVRHGRAPLRRLDVLARPARAHSHDLLLRGAFTHAGAAGSPFWTRLVAAGFPRDRRTAENIAEAPGCGVAAARRTVRMWMASPPHRANLLDRRMRFVGTGAAHAAGCASTILTADIGS
jgi:uncharacterized protein YkwD